jgi:hypothetical protein
LNEINERFIVCVIEIFSRLIPREVKQKSFSNSFTMFYTAFMTLNICFMPHFYQTAYFFFSICLSFSIQNYISLIVTLSSRESHINRSFSLSLDRAKRQPAINSETREQRLYLDVYISMYIHIYIYIQMYIYIYIYIYIYPSSSFISPSLYFSLSFYSPCSDPFSHLHLSIELFLGITNITSLCRPFVQAHPLSFPVSHSWTLADSHSLSLTHSLARST